MAPFSLQLGTQVGSFINELTAPLRGQGRLSISHKAQPGPEDCVIDLVSDSEESNEARTPPPASSRVRSPVTQRSTAIPHRSRESVDMDQEAPRKRARTEKSLFVTGDSEPSTQESNGTQTPAVLEESAFATNSQPVEKASALPDSDLTTSAQAKPVEVIIPNLLEELKQDTAYTTKALLRRARLAARPRATTNTRAAANVFAAMKVITAGEYQPKLKSGKTTLVVNTESWPSSHAKSIKKTVKVSATQLNLKAKHEVPRYSHVIRLQESVLMPNVTMLSCWPYFGDEFQPDSAVFQDYYAVDVDNRPEKLKRLHLAQWLFSTTDSALSQAGLSWADVLGLLFADEQVLQQYNIDIGPLCDSDMPSTARRWEECRDCKGKTDKLMKTFEFCTEFQQHADFSIWHLLRRSELVRTYFASSQSDVNDLGDLDCRVCFRINCTLHGQIRHRHDSAVQDSSEESDDSSSDEQEEQDPADRADIVNPPQVNFRRVVPFQAAEHTDSPVPISRKYKSYWDHKGFTMPDGAGPFFPCHHPGETCEQASCSCFVKKITCEKTCTCPTTCTRKFLGCACSLSKARRAGEFVCFRDDRCACYQMGRECDPDLCGKCGVHEALDLSKSDEELEKLCHNASLQRGLPKHTLLGDSSIHALGLYACEDIKPHDFVGEYKGEVITRREAERRGKIYEHQKLSYLFSLNKGQEVDSTYCGNKIRFINHSKGTMRNLYAHVMLVNSVHRIALFAERHIKPGDELFFNYGDQFPHEQLGGSKKSSKHPSARNQTLVEQFTNAVSVSEKRTTVNKNVKKKGIAQRIAKSKDRPSARSSRATSAVDSPGDAQTRLADYHIAADLSDSSFDG